MTILYRKTPTLSMAAKSSPTVPQELLDKVPIGFKLPMMCFNSTNYEMVSGMSKVIQDMLVVLQTAVGRRFDQPDFGSMLPYLLFEEYDEITKSNLIFYTKTSLETWVGEIVISAVQLDETDIESGFITIQIYFYIKGTSEPFTLAVPKALESGIVIPLTKFTLNGRQIFAAKSVA